MSAPTVTGTVTPPADDLAYWARIARDYDVRRDLVNLENGNWGTMSRPVLEAYLENTRRVNRDGSYFGRRECWTEIQLIRERIAGFLGADAAEIVFTRNATEALKTLIGGYRGLSQNDAVMFTDLDYGAMQRAMRTRATASGCAVIELAVPEPADYRGLIEFYRSALDRHPDVKLLLLTHISHRTGLMMPVREIADLARAREVDVIVDAAHSLGQVPYTMEELGADFAGFNLHKWIGAPLGVGLAYIRADRLAQIAADSAAEVGERGLIEGRVHTGTMNYAALLSLPAALDYHEAIGSHAKAARLRYLRNQWVGEVRGCDGWEILTPDDARLHAGMTSLRRRGLTSLEDNRRLAGWLFDEHRVFTVDRGGVAAGACVRVTPSLFNSLEDTRRLVAALRDFAKRSKRRSPRV